MQIRDSVWAIVAGKDRPAIVRELVHDRVNVAYGARAIHDWPCLAVHVDSRAGRCLGITEATYFYGANVEWVRRAAITRVGRPVPRDLLIDLNILVSQYELTLAAD